MVITTTLYGWTVMQWASAFAFMGRRCNTMDDAVEMQQWIVCQRLEQHQWPQFTADDAQAAAKLFGLAVRLGMGERMGLQQYAQLGEKDKWRPPA